MIRTCHTTLDSFSTPASLNLFVENNDNRADTIAFSKLFQSQYLRSLIIVNLQSILFREVRARVLYLHIYFIRVRNDFRLSHIMLFQHLFIYYHLVL